jgi:hypothetical protein
VDGAEYFVVKGMNFSSSPVVETMQATTSAAQAHLAELSKEEQAKLYRYYTIHLIQHGIISMKYRKCRTLDRGIISSTTKSKSELCIGIMETQKMSVEKRIVIQKLIPSAIYHDANAWVEE